MSGLRSGPRQTRRAAVQCQDAAQSDKRRRSFFRFLFEIQRRGPRRIAHLGGRGAGWQSTRMHIGCNFGDILGSGGNFYTFLKGLVIVMVHSSGAWKSANKSLCSKIVKNPTTIRNAPKIATNVHA